MKCKPIFLPSFGMRMSLLVFAILLFGSFLRAPLYSQLPTAVEIAGRMTIGWNIGNSLEVPSGETDWGNPGINQDLIDAVADAGFNTIRIPCSWDSHADPTTLEIDYSYIDRVAEVVEYCYDNDLYIIINCHWDGGWLENNVTEAAQEEVNRKQEAYWTQIADYFMDYDEYLLFAGTNEPNVDTPAQMDIMMSYHQTFIDAVRATGGNNSSRVLIIQGPTTDIDKTNQWMSSMPTDQIENRLMFEIHYYTPWNFCGMTRDESWGKMFYFWGKDYHSTTNPERNATWGEESTVESLFQSMKTRFVDKDIPVIMGEYSAVKRLSLAGNDLELHIASREYFYRYVTNAAVRYGMIPIYWDNGIYGNNQAALFDRHDGEIVDPGAVEALMLGLSEASPVDEKQENQKSSFLNSLNALPNPVSNTTQIQLNLEKAEPVNISIVNILGQEVACFDNLYFSRGINRVTWNADHLPAGPYFVKVMNEEHMFMKKVTVMH